MGTSSIEGVGATWGLVGLGRQELGWAGHGAEAPSQAFAYMGCLGGWGQRPEPAGAGTEVLGRFLWKLQLSALTQGPSVVKTGLRVVWTISRIMSRLIFHNV